MKGTDNQVVGPNSANKNFVNAVRARRSANGWSSLLDTLVSLIPAYGPWIIFGVVALESAGVPLPGETILVGAALLAGTTGQLNIIAVVVAAAGKIRPLHSPRQRPLADRSLSFFSVWERRRVCRALRRCPSDVRRVVGGSQPYALGPLYVLQRVRRNMLGIQLWVRRSRDRNRNL